MERGEVIVFSRHRLDDLNSTLLRTKCLCSREPGIFVRHLIKSHCGEPGLPWIRILEQTNPGFILLADL